MKEINEIKQFIKELVIEVLELEDLTPDQIVDDAPFFGTDEEPGIIHDSLAVLELATRIGEQYDIMPEEFNEAAFTNVNTLSQLIFEKINAEV
ncbi:MAG: hypothetical protein R2795_13620 [Saprospiraceae bacterium]